MREGGALDNYYSTQIIIWRGGRVMGDQDLIRALVELGVTGLEAEVYTFLLQESPATGYRAAQALGRPVAGIYKALEALAHRGAVVVEEGTTRQYRSVPGEELLGGL